MLLLADMLPTLPELSTLPRDPPTPRLRLMLTLSTPLTVMLDSPTPDTLATPTTTLPTTMLPTVPTATAWDMPLMPPLPLSRLLRLRPLPLLRPLLPPLSPPLLLLSPTTTPSPPQSPPGTPR